MHCSPNKGRADQYYGMGQRDSWPNRFRQLWRQLFPAQHREGKGSPWCRAPTVHQAVSWAPRTDSDTSQTREPLTDRGRGACSTQAPRAEWGAKALHRLTPKLALLLLRFPHESLVLKRSCPTSGFSGKAGSSCKAFHRHLFLTTCLSTFSIDQTVKKQEMSLQDGLNWPGHGLVFVSSQWPAAFQSYP